MNAKPVLAHPHVATTIVAAVLSAFIAIGLLSAVAGLFQRDGTPLAQIVVAEHTPAPIMHSYPSARPACDCFSPHRASSASRAAEALRGNPSMLDSGRTTMIDAPR